MARHSTSPARSARAAASARGSTRRASGRAERGAQPGLIAREHDRRSQLRHAMVAIGDDLAGARRAARRLDEAAYRLDRRHFVAQPGNDVGGRGEREALAQDMMAAHRTEELAVREM